MTRLPGAQKIIQIILRRTNLLMTGKRVTIIGFAPELADRLRALGAHPQARLTDADLVITDGPPPDFALLKADAIVATTQPPPGGVRAREGITGHGHVFVLDLGC